MKMDGVDCLEKPSEQNGVNISTLAACVPKAYLSN